jgi:hypothetical protein
MLMFRRCTWQIKLFCGFSSSVSCFAGVQGARLVELSPRRARCPDRARMSLDRGRGRMCVPITFRDQPQHERRDHEHDYSSLSRCEAESLPHFIEFETAALLDHDLESRQSTTQRNFGFQPETSCRLPSLLVAGQARMPVRRDRHDACVTAQVERRNIRASNENSSQMCDNRCCI